MILNVEFLKLLKNSFAKLLSFLAFNAIVRVCLKQLLPAIYRFLRIKIVITSKLKPETSSNWKYIESIMKKYLLHFTRVLIFFSLKFFYLINLAHIDD